MKKFMTLAAMFAAVMVGFSSCEPEEQPKDQGTEQTPGTNDETPETPGTGDQTPETPAGLTFKIDGNFDDWDVESDAIASCECAEATKYDGLIAMKVYSDPTYLYVYFEFDDDQIVDRQWTTLQLYINADNSDETGGYGDEFADPNAEWLFQGAFLSGEFISCGLATFKWWGEVGGDGWNWTDPEVEATTENNWGAVLGEDSGIAVGAGTGNKYELQITKELCAGVEWADTFTIGLDVQDAWTTKGVLPNEPITDDNPNGLADKLEVTVVK